MILGTTRGARAAEQFLGGVKFTEPLFVVVIMAIASTRPVLGFAEQLMGLAARLGGGTPLAWWLSVLTLGPLLGSFITEPAAMIICAMLLGRRVLDLEPRTAFRYATLGLLFVDVSVGGTLTHFAAPPVLMVAGAFGWDTGFMLSHFGWKAVVGIVRRQRRLRGGLPQGVLRAGRPRPGAGAGAPARRRRPRCRPGSSACTCSSSA